MRNINFAIGCVLMVFLGGCDYGIGPLFPEGDSGTEHHIETDYNQWKGDWRFTLTEPFPTAAEDTSIVTFDSLGNGRGRLGLKVGDEFCPFILTLNINSWGYLQNLPRCLNSEFENAPVRILHSGFWMSGPFASADTNHGTYTVQYCLSLAPLDTVFASGNWTAYRPELP